MGQLFTLGGDRLGSGNKQKVAMHNFEMNSFNLEQDFKSSLAPGVLYPFIKLVGTPHGTFDIDLDTFVRTLPTVGPLFGSFKLQLDLFSVPFRLYQGVLHNNPIDIGLNMNQVYLPKIKIRTIDDGETRVKGSDDNDYQVNTSALIKYLGISGIGSIASTQAFNYVERKFNAVPILAYYDIFKCYYSNKQEDNAYVITPGTVKKDEMDNIKISIPSMDLELTKDDAGLDATDISSFTTNMKAALKFVITGENLQPENIVLSFYYDENHTYTSENNIKDWSEDEDYCNFYEIKENEITIGLLVNQIVSPTQRQGLLTVGFSTEENVPETYSADIALTSFKLKNIDKMRYALLKENELGTEFILGDSNYWDDHSGEDQTGLPYSALFKRTNSGITWNAFTQNGLVVKTYQSDLFNNWLDTEYIDGPNGIAAITAVDTTQGSFTMDTLNLAEKFYELLNRIITAGGTYQDWQEAVYGEGAVRMCETPMYIGGMAAEIMFEEVIATTENGEADQALGSLGGKGTQVNRKGGSNIHVKMDEPGYIMGIVSITPRICYSQGNDWDMTELDSLDDLHKPSLDGIGFQPLMVEQMAWWNTIIAGSNKINRSSAGKQTAWINYQTAVDKCYGDFAKQNGYAFMVLNRNYERGQTAGEVKDITTYIDPAKYNYAFAYAGLDAQNFWVQIHSKVTARRKMGAQQLPNL